MAIIPPAAQKIIIEIIGRLRHSSDLDSILQLAIEMLVTACSAERGLIWQMNDDCLQVTNEFAVNGRNQFINQKQLTAEESAALVLELLSQAPVDTAGEGVVSIPNTSNDRRLHKISPTLATLIELGGVRSRLIAQLKSRGLFFGFLELQQCSDSREWNVEDSVVIEKVAEVLSVVVQQAIFQSRIKKDADEMKLINEIGGLFRESRGVSTRQSLVKSVTLVANHMGFVNSEIYLFERDKNCLVPQTHDGAGTITLESKQNPFVEVFLSGQQKLINEEYNRKPHPTFRDQMALVLPLVSEGTRLGVIGLWKRAENRHDLHKELGITIAGHLSDVIRADQAIQQLREDQARSALINRVSNEIRNALKSSHQIMETLVESLLGHFKLDLCVCSLYNESSESFTDFKIADAARSTKNQDEHNLGEYLFQSYKEELKSGETIFLPREQLEKRIAGLSDVPPLGNCKAAHVVPLFHAGNFKGALCLISPHQESEFSEKDMHMIIDLADRVAVVVAHTELFATIEHRSITDAMTGLYNRRHFEAQLEKEIDRNKRFGHSFSLIIIDLDYLKRINDTLGHHFGDKAIKHIGNVVRKSVRDVDTVGRYGGEEFVVILPETELKSAKIVAERICCAIRERPLEEIGTVTASLGVAVFPRDAANKDKLFELADAALFLAKGKGRNQVCTVAEDMNTDSQQIPTEELKRKVDENRYANVSPKPALTLMKSDPTAEFDLAAEEWGILAMLSQIVKLLEDKDSYGKRAARVSGYARQMGQSLNLSKEHTDTVSLAAVLCNMGKIAVPEEILQKQGPLTEEELALIREVPARGAKMLEPARMLTKLPEIVNAFRENWDGTGYPSGIRGSDIPVESQIVSLVDSFVAMTSQRPYREALSRDQAIDELLAESGKKWDARLVKIFLSILQREDA